MVTKGEWDRKIAEYRARVKKFGEIYKALKWDSSEAMEIRHVQAVSDLGFEGRSILDVGCGLGDILSFIKKKTKKFTYTGVDFVEEFIEGAKSRHPEHNFILRNYFNNPLNRNFDIIICSGVLNSKFKNTTGFRKEAIKILFAHCRSATVFNMVGSHPQPTNKRSSSIYYADSLEILKFCLTLTKKIIFRHHYHSKDFTIIMFR